MSPNCLALVQPVAAILSNVATVAMLIFTWKLVRLNETLTTLQVRQVWFTGAMESHSMLMLQIEAARGTWPGYSDNKPIEMVWWDADYAEKPVRRHGDPINLDRLKFFVHPDIRADREPETRSFHPLTWSRRVGCPRGPVA